MNKIFILLVASSIIVFGVNACGQPCTNGCAPDECCSMCCPGSPDCINDDGTSATPNICGPCPGCPEDAKVCPDGTVLSREGPNCEFPECPPCVPSRGPCLSIYDPVCCDGITYSNNCEATNACATDCGNGACPTPCDLGTDGYCVDQTGQNRGCLVETCILDPCNNGNNGGCNPQQKCTASNCVGPCTAQCGECTDGYCINKEGNCVSGSIWACLVDPCGSSPCKNNEDCTANYCNGCDYVCTKKNGNGNGNGNGP